MTLSFRSYCFLAISLLWLEGCFKNPLEQNQDGVFACSPATEAADCPEGRCINGVCIFSDLQAEDCTQTQAPVIAFEEPEFLEAFSIDATTLRLVLSGRNLQVVNPQLSDPQAQGQGHVKIFIDSQPEPIHTFLEGSLDAANLTQDIELNPPLSPGLHRLRALTFNNSGIPLANICSASEVAFWIDDGKEHVGIVRPSPGTVVDLGAGSVDIEVEVAGLNFTFIHNTDTPPNNEEVFGHVHTFINPPSDFANCLNACDGDESFRLMILPPKGSLPTTTMVGTLSVPDSLGTGPATLAIDARNSNHERYFRGDTNLPEDLVFHQIQLQIERRSSP